MGDIPYKLGRKLGTGAYGTVHEATRPSDSKKFAVKIYAGEDDEDLERFRREVRLQSELNHRNIVPVAANLEADPPYIVMPMADSTLLDVVGTSLTSEADILDTFRQISEAIGHAHEQGMVHRDLKPDNILFFGTVPKVADFGLVRELNPDSVTLTRSDQPLGSVAYAAPEQLRQGHDVGVTADIYSLGKLLYYMFTKEHPFPDLDASRLRGGVRYLVTKCVRKDPEARYRSVKLMLDDLADLTSEHDLVAEPIKLGLELLHLADVDGRPDPDRLTDLVRHLLDCPQLADLYKKVVPSFTRAMIERCFQRHRSEMIEILQTFDRHIGGQLLLSQVDAVARLYRDVFRQTDEPEIREMLIRRLIQTGAHHNRSYVRDRVVQMLFTTDDPGGVLSLKSALRSSDPADVIWLSRGLDVNDLRPALRDAFLQAFSR